MQGFFAGFFFDLLTSLYGALLSIRAGKGVDEVGKGAMAAEQLLVRATLGNFSICHNQNMVGLWQEAHPMGHKNAGLHGEPHECRKKLDVSAIRGRKNEVCL